MDKYDIKEKWGEVKDVLNDGKVVINRRLKDMSFSSIFIKKFSVNGIVALVICLALLCAIGFVANYTCTNEIQAIATNTAMEINKFKTSNQSLTQGDVKIHNAVLDAYTATQENPLVNDCAVALYDLTNRKTEQYSSPALRIDDKNATKWYCDILNDNTAAPILYIDSNLKDFIKEHDGKDFVITKMSVVNKIITPETVEARGGLKTETWTSKEWVPEDREVWEQEVPVRYVGNDLYSPYMMAFQNLSFESSLEGINVKYDKEALPNRAKVVSQQFTINETNYQVDIVYDYAGLSAMFWYMFIIVVLIFGAAVLVTSLQTRKERDI